jgi:hypothetical protein
MFMMSGCGSGRDGFAVTPPPAAAAAGPIVVVSDLHGNLQLLLRALDEAARVAGRDDLTVVLLGDYCDNGYEVQPLLEFLCGVVLDNGGRHGNMTLVPILGNHDLACLLVARPGVFGSCADVAAADDWWRRWHYFWKSWEVGTPANYGLPHGCGPQAFRDAFPDRHRRLLEELPWCVRLDGYVFVHAGLQAVDASLDSTAESQLCFLDNKDLGALRRDGGGVYDTHRGGGYGMPDQVTSKAIDETSSAAWGAIVVTGHNKYETQRDFVAPHRLGMHSCACRRTRDVEGNPLHCALLARGAQDLTAAGSEPKSFTVA